VRLSERVEVEIAQHNPRLDGSEHEREHGPEHYVRISER
jgi:hypothetical protein